MRSGQLDLIGGYESVEWMDAESLIETNPELLYMQKPSGTVEIMQFDLRNPPFGPMEDEDARKVRRALSMAIDRESIVELYYEGNAKIITSNCAVDVYGMDEAKYENLPRSSQELFEYNPEKARELLTEAGYPQGLKTTLNVVWDAPYFSIIQSFWEDIGVEAEMHIMDYGAITAKQYGHTMTDVMHLYWSYALETGWRFFQRNDPWEKSIGNFNGVNDPEINALYERVTDTDLPPLPYDERLEYYEDMVLEAIDGAYEIIMPVPLTYDFWQPWVRGYHGEDHVGINQSRHLPAYIWIDESFE